MRLSPNRVIGQNEEPALVRQNTPLCPREYIMPQTRYTIRKAPANTSNDVQR